MENTAAESAPTATAAQLDSLAARLVQAKFQAAQQRQQILDLEEAILSLAGCKPEGSQTTHTAAFKITTTGRITRTLDAEAVEKIYRDDLIPLSVYKRLFNWEPKLVLAELRFIEMNEPEHFKAIANALTSKPAKPAVAVYPL